MNLIARYKTPKRYHAFVVSLSISILGVYTQGLKFWNGPMYGDDYLTVSAFIAEKNFFSGILHSGLSKWRPLNNIYLYFSSKNFGFDYLPYLVVNRLLLILCGVTIGLLTYSLFKSLLAVALVSYAVTISHLTYMGQITVFGFLEFGSTVFLMVAIYSAISSIELQEKSPRSAEFLQILSASSFLCSCLTHERFQIGSLCFWYLFKKMSRKSKRIQSRSLLFLFIPCLITVIKLIGGINPLAGGGEASFTATVFDSLKRNFGHSILGLFGYYSGSGKGFGSSAVDELSSYNHLRILGLAITLLPFSFICLHLFIQVIRQKPLAEIVNYKFWFLGSLLIFFLIPGSTVISRIEARWLYQSQVLLLILFFSITNQTFFKKTFFHVLSFVQVLAFIGISTLYNFHSSDFTTMRNQASSVIAELEKVSPSSGTWHLAINHSGLTMPTSWQFAYGESFSQLSNPPTVVTDCSKFENCLTVYLQDASLDFEIR